MPTVRFSKYEGLANDFIVIDGHEYELTADAAVRLCDRRRGIGADGVLSLLPARDSAASIRMHVYNADGSVAQMCGNGLRCVVRHFLAGRNEDSVVVDTDGGLLQGWLREDGRVRVTMGEVAMIAESVEAATPDASFSAVALSVGNPHLVLEPFPSGADLMKAATQYGARFERHPQFPDRVNVGFVSVDTDEVRLVVHERGAGITQACGTGAAAAAVASLRRDPALSNPVRVRLPGGVLDVDVTGEPRKAAVPADVLARVTITGDARHVFDGRIGVDAAELRPPGRSSRD